MGRPCRHCGAKISRLADRCPECGGANDAQNPWYVYVIGGVIVLSLFFWLADLDSLGRLIDDATTLLGR